MGIGRKKNQKKQNGETRARGNKTNIKIIPPINIFTSLIQFYI